MTSNQSLRNAYNVLVAETILRYVRAGHAFSISTLQADGAVEVTLTFEPVAFSEYFQHLGATDRERVPEAALN
jgi:hypothetical protein